MDRGVNSEDISYVVNDSHIQRAIEPLRADGDFDVAYTPPTGEMDFKENYAELGGAPWAVSPGIFYWGDPPQLSIVRRVSLPLRTPDKG